MKAGTQGVWRKLGGIGAVVWVVLVALGILALVIWMFVAFLQLIYSGATGDHEFSFWKAIETLVGLIGTLGLLVGLFAGLFWGIPWIIKELRFYFEGLLDFLLHGRH